MYINNKVFVIVDAYSTGKYLSPLINANGYACIHLQSSKKVIPALAYSFVDHNFIKNIVYDDDIKNIVLQLAEYKVLGVIPGTETGVILADLLSNALGLNTANSLQLSSARRNKYDMVNCLVKNNIPYAKSFESADLQKILHWVKEHGEFPVVVKPLSSAASDGVKICHCIDDVSSAFNAIMNMNDIFNTMNQKVMVQQFLDGQEYIVNTVSYDGKHKVVDIWRKFKNKINGIPINDYAEIVDISEVEYEILPRYIFNVLDALEIKYGAGHSEIMMTGNGPILIETAARLEGSIDPSAVNEATGNNHIHSLVNSYLDSDKFLQSCSNLIPVKKYVRHTFLASPIDGVVMKQPDFLKVINLPSFHSLSFTLKPGDELVKTTSLADFPGFIYLVSEDRHQVEKDYHFVREFEKSLYSDICN